VAWGKERSGFVSTKSFRWYNKASLSFFSPAPELPELVALLLAVEPVVSGVTLSLISITMFVRDVGERNTSWWSGICRMVLNAMRIEVSDFLKHVEMPEYQFTIKSHIILY
jgi:hypothetical protein